MGDEKRIKRKEKKIHILRKILKSINIKWDSDAQPFSDVGLENDFKKQIEVAKDDVQWAERQYLRHNKKDGQMLRKEKQKKVTLEKVYKLFLSIMKDKESEYKVQVENKYENEKRR